METKVRVIDIAENPNKPHIKYYINDEKGVCVAVLDGIKDDIRGSMRERLAQLGLDDCTYNWPYTDLAERYMKNVPDTLSARSTCSPHDKFNEETGCAIARARLLAKLYKLRARVADEVRFTLASAVETFTKQSDYYYDRMSNYLSQAAAAETAEV